MKNLDKTSIIGIAVCIVLMVVLFMRMSARNAEMERQQAEQNAAMPTDAQQPQPPASSEAAQVPQQAVGAAQTPAAQQPIAAAPTTSSTLAPADPELPFGAALRAKPSEKPISLVRDGEATFNVIPRHGVVSVVMQNYKRQREGKEDPGPVVLGNYDCPFLTVSSVDGEAQWCEPKADDNAVSVSDGTVSVRRVSRDGTVEMTEIWSVPKDDSYELHYDVIFKNLTQAPVQVANVAVEVGALSPLMAGKGEEGFGGVAYMLPPVHDNHCEEFPASKLKKFAEARAKLNDPNVTQSVKQDAMEDIVTIRELAWAAVHTRYFMQAVRSRDPQFRFAALEAFSCDNMPGEPKADPYGRFRARLVLPAVIVPAGATQTFQLSGFAGPKDLNMLSGKKIGLDGTLGVDRFFMWTPRWMGALSMFFLNSLLWLSKLFPGKMALGFALILLTIIVKLVFWPLSHRSSRSMKKMQELQPQLKEIREKYKSDPQEMYRRQQQLYKDNNVSQLGGCLPMLVQIPIFFALFNTFRGSIELRQACFLWAEDLSLPDTVLNLSVVGLNPMALIMVGTMIWQQVKTPTGDPSQKRMMIIMSLMFTYFLYTQPSGLTLYMTVNQLLSMLQFHIIKKLDAREEAMKKNGGKPIPSTR